MNLMVCEVKKMLAYSDNTWKIRQSQQ